MAKILFVMTQDLLSPLGAGRVWPFARELSCLGHEIKIVALHPNFEAVSQKKFILENIEVHYAAPMHVKKNGNQKTYYSAGQLLGVAARASFQLTRSVLNSTFDVVHICKPHPMNGIAGLIGSLLKGKKVFLDSDDYEKGSNRFQNGFQRNVISFFEDQIPHYVDLITTNTYFTQNLLVQNGIPAKKIFYISNGIDRKRFLSPDVEEIYSLKKQLGLENHFVVGFAGSLSLTSHPVDLLLESFVIIKSLLPKSKLLLVGGGEDFDFLRDKAFQLGIEGDVIFTGKIPSEKVVNYYKLMDVSVDPVHNDFTASGRSPLKLFESWACGVPFVSAKIGDRERLAGDPPAAHLVESCDPKLLAKAIVEVLTFPELSDSLRRQGLHRAEDYYWDKIARDAQIIYLPAQGR